MPADAWGSGRAWTTEGGRRTSTAVQTVDGALLGEHLSPEVQRSGPPQTFSKQLNKQEPLRPWG